MQTLRNQFNQSCWLALVLFCLAGVPVVWAQAPEFSYQGRFTDGGVAANGSFDLRFSLFDAVASGVQQGATLTREDVVVTNGIFTVQLDFGAVFPGAARWLEIAVRPGASTGTFTVLSPRQPVRATPYAIRSLNAGAADGLTAACVGCVTSTQVGSINGNAVNGAIPVASIPAGSGNYVQNTTTQQTTSNFNISGDGTAGGTLSGNAVNAVTQYNLGGQRVLSATGTNTFNTFVGLSAGAANTTGGANVFVGQGAGQANNTGASNTFVGRFAGTSNTTGAFNTFVGHQAGIGNLTACCNSFFGNGAGGFNATGESNAFFGGLAGGNNTSGGGNSFFGSFAGLANTTASNNSFFGALAGWKNTTGTENAFFGRNAGAENTTASDNTFVGSQAGAASTTGFSNSFFGREAGRANTEGHENAFFGRGAGSMNTTGNFNSFFGVNAGQLNTGSANSFFGIDAGQMNSTGSENAFFGSQAGEANSLGAGNTFVGEAAGQLNTMGGANVFLGRLAGTANTLGSNNTLLGTRANAGGNNLTNATALGYRARVDCSDCLVLGSVNGVNGATATPNVGIGTPAPATKFEVANDGNTAAHVFTTSYGAVNNAIIGRQAGGSLAAPSATTSDLALLFLGGRGHTGAGFATVSRVGIGLEASEDWTAAANGTRITFDTTANGTTNRLERMRIDQNGRVGIGTTAPAAPLHVIGNATITGTLTKGGGAFKIDHPLDPENKYLYHSFVESPDMKNIYDGNVTTDAVGLAEVVLPAWFEALNRDFRYQLTVLGQFAQAIVAEKIKGNRFKIRTSLPNVEVSWQVTGIRQDAFAERHRIPVEEVKPERERGSYLHPAVFDQAEEKGVEGALRPEMMRKMKERREKAKQPATPTKPAPEKP